MRHTQGEKKLGFSPKQGFFLVLQPQRVVSRVSGDLK